MSTVVVWKGDVGCCGGYSLLVECVEEVCDWWVEVVETDEEGAAVSD